MNLTLKVIVGMALGVVVGLAINFSGLHYQGSFVQEFITGGLFYVVGKMFINALNMMVVPLVLFSLICGVCGIGDVKLLGKIGSKSFAFYVLTTAVAIASAIVIAGGLGIGEGMNATSEANFTAREAPPLTDVLINIIPTNPISAMARGEMLSIIFFAILFGISLLMVGIKATKVIELIEVLNETMMKMVTIIMALAPYAVFCLLAKAMAELGIDLFTQLIGYVVVLAGILLVHLFITLMFFLKVFSGLSPPHIPEKNTQCAGVCLQYFKLERHGACNPAHRDRTHGREQLSGFFHGSIRCHHQYGWHGHHARCGHRVYRQYVWCRPWRGRLSHRDHDVGFGIHRHRRCSRCRLDHAVHGVHSGWFAT
jgi:L-cystine uptake protein TcyP (sodium:dicarboxylate symporter family)